MKTLLVIFGITGDLSGRKLLPALSHIIADNPEHELSILGVSRREADVKKLVLDSTASQDLAKRTELHTMDLAEIADYAGLKDTLTAYDADQTLMYLAVPPGAAAQIVDLLGAAGINSPDIHLLFEKPFGYDLESAQDFLQRTAEYFSEEQIFRIDHYMAKEVSAEVIRLRRNAQNHHHSWGNASIKAIEIVASESIGIEGRASFYEQTGALRDFVQGHLMQLLSLVLMKIPAELNNDDIPALRLAALNSINVATTDDGIRAQYDGYQEEVQNPGSQTETFVSINLTSDDENWQDVPLRLTTGKALNEKRSYIDVHYKDGTNDVFEEGKVTSEGGRQLDAYERVLLEAIAGRKALFTSGEEVLRSWEILTYIQQAWAMNQAPLKLYPQGSAVEAVIES
ncbi:MAG: Glucose-6-phosphate 1-dehydrogenase [Candidatus Saccharibacteria bacterium]|nr:Glucose-6-phosphate 1-dehydrogenase [Candidatus Saccharibacteria bacterium]